MNEIIVDTAEPKKVQQMFKTQGIKHKVEKLLIGDFVCNEVCIERKSMPDFVSSIKSGHLQKQLLQMQENYKQPFLIISGSLKELHALGEIIRRKSRFNPYAGWTVNHHVGALASVGVRYNVKVLQVDNDTQLVKLVSRIIEKAFDGKVKTYLDTELLAQKDKMGIEDTKLLMLKSIPNIGLERALTLRDHVDIKLTLHDGSELTENYLYNLDGFGDAMVKNVIKINKK